MDRGYRVAQRIRRQLGAELRTARLSAGASQAAVAERAGVPRSTYGRLERSGPRDQTIEQYARASAALGLRLVVRLYPDGDPIRDAGQQALLVRFRRRLDPSLLVRTEVPVRLAGDVRSWDLSIEGTTWSIRVDAETRLYDIQAQTRRLELKRRDDRIDVVVLLVADTNANRRILREWRVLLRGGFPLDTRAVLAALASGRRPNASGIVLI
jgi:transcriptional regulator with XRE-family HTH domain